MSVIKILDKFLTLELTGNLATDELLFNNTSLNSQMRNIVVNWLIEVSNMIKLQTKTTILAISYLDTFINNNNEIHKENFQIYGIVCLDLASKMTEIYAPDIYDYEIISKGKVTTDDIIENEIIVYDSLNHKLIQPTLYIFYECYKELHRNTEDNIIDWNTIQYSKSILLASLLNIDSLKFLPSIIALSSLIVGKWLSDKKENIKFDIIKLINNIYNNKYYETNFTYNELIYSCSYIINMLRNTLNTNYISWINNMDYSKINDSTDWEIDLSLYNKYIKYILRPKNIHTTKDIVDSNKIKKMKNWELEYLVLYIK